MTAASGEQFSKDPRVYFAAERTLLAWVRTGLALMGFGFVLARFGLFLREAQAVLHMGTARGSSFSVGSGIVLVLVGVAVNILSIVRYRQNIARLNKGEMTPTEPSVVAMGTAAMLAVLGIVIIGYLLYFR